MKCFAGLTGTPTSNGLMDYWTEMGTLDSGKRLGRFTDRCCEAYFKTADMNMQTDIVHRYDRRPEAEDQLF